jgi:WD40 repeat protein
MTDLEWATKIGDLSENGQWDEMWRLTQTAPGIWAQRIIMHLVRSNWQPDNGEDRLAWPRMSGLAERCAQVGIPPQRLGSQVPHNGTLGSWGGPDISPDGNMAIQKAGYNRSYLYSLPVCKLIKEISGESPQFSPDGKFLVTEVYDGYIRIIHLYSLHDGELIKEISGESPQFSPGGKLLVIETVDEDIWISHLYSLPDGELIKEISGKRPEFSSDGKFMVTEVYDEGISIIHLWYLPEGRHIKEIKCSIRMHQESRFSPDGKMLTIIDFVGKDECTYLWGLPEGEFVGKFNGRYPEFSPDGKMLITFCILEKSIYRAHYRSFQYGLPEGELIRTIEGSAVFSVDGKMLATDEGENTQLWHLPTGRLIKKIEGTGPQFSPDGEVLLTIEYDDYSEIKAFHLWHLPEGELIREVAVRLLDGPEFSPDGNVLLTQTTQERVCEEDINIIHMYSLPDGELIKEIRCIESAEQPMFSPNGNVLATEECKYDEDINTIHLYSLPDCELIRKLRGYTWFSPDGRWMSLSIGTDEFELWRLPPINLESMINTPIHKIIPAEVDRMTGALEGDSLVDSLRLWLDFLLMLVRHHRRFDIELDEAPQSVEPNEFDIEIDE